MYAWSWAIIYFYQSLGQMKDSMLITFVDYTKKDGTPDDRVKIKKYLERQEH